MVVWLSVKPSTPLPWEWTDILGTDKIGHLIFYAILTILIGLGLLKQPNLALTQRTTINTSGIISGIYGILMEFIQYGFFPHRYFEILDIFANIVGCFLGIFLIKKLYKNSTL